jgi:hypothetical protein
MKHERSSSKHISLKKSIAFRLVKLQSCSSFHTHPNPQLFSLFTFYTLRFVSIFQIITLQICLRNLWFHIFSELVFSNLFLGPQFWEIAFRFKHICCIRAVISYYCFVKLCYNIFARVPFPFLQSKDLTLVGTLFIVETGGFNGPIVFCSQSLFDSNRLVCCAFTNIF